MDTPPHKGDVSKELCDNCLFRPCVAYEPGLPCWFNFDNYSTCDEGGDPDLSEKLQNKEEL